MSNPPSSETATANYRIGGMTCGGCVASVTKALQQQLPSVEVKVSLEEGTATVVGQHDAAAARQAIDDAGFDVLDG